MQERKRSAIGRDADGVVTAKKLWAGHNYQLRSDEQDRKKARIVTKPMPDCHIDWLALQVHDTVVGFQLNVNMRMKLRKARLARNQPVCRKGRHSTDADATR
ncbi:hypothetical protein ASG03_03415 [Rhizobium sp. Leaf341]|nr:hypothetical protein ASG03_03415 [Rhizobium sp. Leaf341]